MLSQRGPTSNLSSASVPKISALPTRACPKTCGPIDGEDHRCRCEKGATAKTYSGQMPTNSTELLGCGRGDHVPGKPRTPNTDDPSLRRPLSPLNKTCFGMLSPLSYPNTRAAHHENPLLQIEIAGSTTSCRVDRNCGVDNLALLGKKLLRTDPRLPREIFPTMEAVI